MLQVTGVRKEFPGVVALDSVDFSLAKGEIRALMGENGAGKSTLIKVITGVYPADRGTIALDGREIKPRSPADAQALGISMVYQEVNLAPNLSVAENICLGDETRRLGRIDWRAMNDRARRSIDKLELRIDVSQPLGSFSTAVQQLVAIARAIDREARVLVLDEPTSSLDRDEAERLFGLMRDLRRQGVAIVFVTHFLDQAYAVSDSITVLRNGLHIGTWPSAELPKHELVRQMLGKELLTEAESISKAPPTGDAFVEICDLGKSRVMEPVSFAVRRGEVLGLSGLLGSGRTETMKLVFGALQADSGSLKFGGRSTRIKSPGHAVRLGMGLCPEDRKLEGILPGLSLRENLLLVLQARRGWARRLPRSRQRELVEQTIVRLGIKATDAEKPIDHLSGGNQQKAMLGRWLLAEPTFLMLDEPTRGVDIGSKAEIRRQVRELAANGMTLLFSSSELEEIVHTCDRAVVLRDRAKVGELAGEALTEEAVMERMAKSGGQ